MLEQLKKIVRYVRFYFSTAVLGQHLKNKQFTLVANDCWGRQVYQGVYVPYQTPFIGLFLDDIDYLRLLQNFSWYISQKLIFIEKSRYDRMNKLKNEYPHKFPIGLLGGDIEIYFLHYKNEEEAFEKWERRKARMCWDNIFFVLKTNSPESILTFLSLPFEKKICFTNQKKYSSYDGVVYTPISNTLFSEGPVLSFTYFNAVNWLNGKDWHIRSFVRRVLMYICYVDKYTIRFFERTRKRIKIY